MANFEQPQQNIKEKITSDKEAWQKNENNVLTDYMNNFAKETSPSLANRIFQKLKEEKASTGNITEKSILDEAKLMFNKLNTPDSKMSEEELINIIMKKKFPAPEDMNQKEILDKEFTDIEATYNALVKNSSIEELELLRKRIAELDSGLKSTPEIKKESMKQIVPLAQMDKNIEQRLDNLKENIQQAI